MAELFCNQLTNLYYSSNWPLILSEEHELKLSNKKRTKQKPQT